MKTGWGKAEPQSNQRGIETLSQQRGGSLVVGRLNRTSVGLKQGGTGKTTLAVNLGLNRTSVGLKLWPNSPPLETWTASIEPAWD